MTASDDLKIFEIKPPEVARVLDVWAARCPPGKRFWDLYVRRTGEVVCRLTDDSGAERVTAGATAASANAAAIGAMSEFYKLTGPQ